MLEYAREDSPTVSRTWADLDSDTRLERVISSLKEDQHFGILAPTQARADGQVFVEMTTPVAAGERGVLLRAAEAHLKAELDRGITLWCEPLGDKNSLRNLRGIQVRT